MSLHPFVLKKMFVALPGVGESIAQDLIDLKVQGVADLARRKPEKLYEDLCKLRGTQVDRCVLYVFRCAIYSLNTPNPDPQLLHWWRWSDNVLEQKKRK